MVGAQDGDAVIVVEAATQFADTERRAGEPLGSGRAERAKVLGPDDRQLLLQKMPAIGDFVRQWRAVAGRPALEDVANVDLLPPHLHALGEDGVEKLSGGSDERFAEPIFFRSGRFADEAKLGIRIADAEDGLRAVLHESGAARAWPYLSVEKLQGVALLLGSPYRLGGRRRREKVDGR